MSGEKKLDNLTNKISDGIHTTPNYDDNGNFYFVNGNNLVDGIIKIDEKTKRVNETLFIDASEMGFMKDRVHREFSPEDIKKIEDTYHNWRKEENYEDIKGFCKSANIEDIEKHGFVLTPGRYVGITHQEDDGISYEEKIEELQATLKAQIEKEAVLNEKIKIQRQIAFFYPKN